MDADGGNHQKLSTYEGSESSPRWSPTGDRLAFVSSTDEGSEIYLYWVNTGRIARLSQLENSPGNLSWSADGTMIAFTMMVNQAPPVLAEDYTYPTQRSQTAVPRPEIEENRDSAGRNSRWRPWYRLPPQQSHYQNSPHPRLVRNLFRLPTDAVGSGAHHLSLVAPRPALQPLDFGQKPKPL